MTVGYPHRYENFPAGRPMTTFLPAPPALDDASAVAEAYATSGAGEAPVSTYSNKHYNWSPPPYEEAAAISGLNFCDQPSAEASAHADLSLDEYTSHLSDHHLERSAL